MYTTNILIRGRTESEHLNNVDLVLEGIQEVGMKLKTTKCEFFHKEVSFLGYVLFDVGLQPDPTTVEQVQVWAPPQNVIKVGSFLGSVSYYHRYTKEFTKLAGSLNELLEKNNRLVWSDECEAASTQLRLALRPMSALPPPDLKEGAGELIIDRDASENAIGGVLSRIGWDHKEHLIAYERETWYRRERSYCTARMEMLSR